MRRLAIAVMFAGITAAASAAASGADDAVNWDDCTSAPFLSADARYYCRWTRAEREQWAVRYREQVGAAPETHGLDYCRDVPADALSDKALNDCRKATLPHNDPGAVSLCPAPHRMTRDGCQ